MGLGWLRVNLEPKYVYVTAGKTQKNGFKDASWHNAGSIICLRSMTGNAKRCVGCVGRICYSDIGCNKNTN